ncbi:hypothetical protein Tco_0280635 [Tanacetum coccineum]
MNQPGPLVAPYTRPQTKEELTTDEAKQVATDDQAMGNWGGLAWAEGGVEGISAAWRECCGGEGKFCGSFVEVVEWGGGGNGSLYGRRLGVRVARKSMGVGRGVWKVLEYGRERGVKGGKFSSSGGEMDRMKRIISGGGRRAKFCGSFGGGRCNWEVGGREMGAGNLGGGGKFGQWKGCGEGFWGGAGSVRIKGAVGGSGEAVLRWGRGQGQGSLRLGGPRGGSGRNWYSLIGGLGRVGQCDVWGKSLEEVCGMGRRAIVRGVTSVNVKEGEAPGRRAGEEYGGGTGGPREGRFGVVGEGERGIVLAGGKPLGGIRGINSGVDWRRGEAIRRAGEGEEVWGGGEVGSGWLEGGEGRGEKFWREVRWKVNFLRGGKGAEIIKFGAEEGLEGVKDLWRGPGGVKVGWNGRVNRRTFWKQDESLEVVGKLSGEEEVAREMIMFNSGKLWLYDEVRT